MSWPATQSCYTEEAELLRQNGLSELGNNAVDGQDYQGEFPSEDKEEEGVDVYADVTGPFGREAFIVWRQTALSRLT